MADAKFSIGQINITNYLRVIAREVANPSAVVYNQTFAAPHPPIRNFVITGLNSVTHFFDFYETASTGSTGTLLATFTIDVGLINQSSIEIVEFVVGAAGSPANGDTDYVNTDLDGIATTHLEVFQRSVGIRSWTDEIAILPGGGFSLLGGELFNQDDRWFINVIKDTTVAATTGNSKIFENVKFINTNVTLNSAYYNSLIIVNGGTGWITSTMPDLATVPDHTRFTFNLQKGFVTGLIIDVPNGVIENINGFSDSKFYLRRGEVASFIVYQNTLILIDGKGNWDKVGNQVIVENPNNVNKDFSTIKELGQWVNIVDEPRLFYWFVNKLPPAYLAATSTTEMTKWYIDMPNNRFRIPDSQGCITLGNPTYSTPGFAVKLYLLNTSTSSFTFSTNFINRIL